MLKISYAGYLGLSQIIHQNPLFLGFRVVPGRRRWYPRKARRSASYDKQQVCIYLQPLSC